MGFCQARGGAAADAVLCRGDAAGRAVRRHQLGRVAIQAGDEGGRQMALVALRGHIDAGAAQRGETAAVAGAGLGAVVAVDGAGGAQVGEAFGGVRGPVLRPPCGACHR
jgi:hypothetical protein